MSHNQNTRSAKPQWIRKFSRPLSKLFSKSLESRDDVDAILQQAHRRNIIDDDALGIMEGAIRIMDMQARDIMIPFSQMRVLKINDDRDTCLQTIADTGHSRFPVLGANEGEVAGIVLAKDFIRSNSDNKDFEITSIMRDSSIIPESKRLTVLLREFREQRYHMAIVIDEYGSISGLLTIEDILEEIVGEIEDETDEEEVVLIQSLDDSDKKFLIQTQLSIEYFNEIFDCGFSDDDFDTIGGMLLHHFGRIPAVGDSTTIEQFTFIINDANERRILSAKLEITTSK